jgi:hypothetical protein
LITTIFGGNRVSQPKFLGCMFDKRRVKVGSSVLLNQANIEQLEQEGYEYMAATIYSFTTHFPDAKIFAEGSNEARTRLYRIGMYNNLEEIEKDFAILGLFNDKWKRFVRNKNFNQKK